MQTLSSEEPKTWQKPRALLRWLIPSVTAPAPRSFFHVNMMTWGTFCLAPRTKLTVGCFVTGKKRLKRFHLQLQSAVSQAWEWQPATAETVGGYNRLKWRELEGVWSRDVTGKAGCCRDKECSRQSVLCAGVQDSEACTGKQKLGLSLQLPTSSAMMTT